MRTRTAFGRSAVGAVGLSLAMAVLAAGCSGGSGADADEGVPECQRDDSEGPETAVVATIGQQVEGYLCPEEDEDWYRVELSSDTGLLEINLAMTSTITPVEPTYAVWSMDGAGVPDTVTAAPAPEAIGGPLDEVHCIDPGAYYVVVRDSGDNAQDLRHAYKLTVTTAAEPDTHEPNDAPAAATPLTSGVSVEGAIACVGDQDWYKITVPAGDLLRIRLEADIAGYEPGFQVLDAAEELVVENFNPRGQLEATDIDTYRVLPGAGQYYVVVGDDDGVDADPTVMYTLTVDSVNDPDPNEPNNDPDEATPLAGSVVSCGGSWSSWINQTGTVGSPGDNDWFELPLTGCGKGLIEVELTMNYSGLSDQEQWELQQEVQASVAMVRRHPASACSSDETCRTLSLACDDMWDCSGYFNNCLGEGLCAGATVCLDGGVCGANQTERHYTALSIPGTITEPPPANVARIGAPILGDTVIYLRVSDFQSNGGTPAAGYSMRVRVRAEPDGAEVDNIYNTYLNQSPTEDVILSTRISAAARTMSVGSGTTCNYIGGRISYDNDVDWFKFDHPCPGNSCNLELRYQSASGPVDHVLAIYHQSNLFIDMNVGNGVSGTYGGSSTCFYAYEGHSGPYYIAVRDLATPTRDWNPDQTYQICIIKTTDSCQPPCQIWPETGCGP